MLQFLDRYRQRSTPVKYSASIIAGFLLPYAYAPHSIWILAIVSLLIMLWVCENSTAKQTFKLAFLFGYLFYCFSTGSAINQCFRELGYKPQALSMFLTGSFFVVVAFFIAAPFYILKSCYPTYNKRALCLGLPSAWVIGECVRTWLFTGYPFLLLGYTQLNTVLKNYAAVISAYGVSFIVMLLVGVCYTRNKTLITVTITGICLCGYLLPKFTATHMSAEEYSVSIVQPNITPRVKQIMTAFDQWGIYSPLTQLSFGSSLIIWPELSIPTPYPYIKPMLDGLDQIAKKNNATLLLGLQYKLENDPGSHNSLMVLGNGSGIYHKQHLVPLWEETPKNKTVKNILTKLDVLQPQMVEGPKGQANVVVANSIILPLICFELAFADSVRDRLLETEAEVLVNISEDGWFADSWGPEQHLDVARMRALETGRYVLRATTSGYSAIIDNRGTVLKSAPLFKSQVLKGVYKNASGFTPWTHLGLPRLISILAFVLLFSMLQVKYIRILFTHRRLLPN